MELIGMDKISRVQEEVKLKEWSKKMYPSNQPHLPTPVKTCDNVLKNKVGAFKWINANLITGQSR